MKDKHLIDALIRELALYRETLIRERSADLFQLPFPGTPGTMPPELAARFPDLDPAFGASVSMSLQSQYCSRSHRLAAAVGLCQSPIEAKFLLALVCACAMNDLAISIVGDDESVFFATDGAESDTVLHVSPQAEIAGHHVDFALELQFMDPYHKMALMFNKPKPTNTPEVVVERLVVECDGHEFHGKTRDQAKRDKSRDRDLLSDGYPVIRFTGSEIFQTPLKCAVEVVRDVLGINK